MDLRTEKILKKIKSRLHYQNKNWLAIICGGTGTGKSAAALVLASLIDPDFTVDNIVFSPREFLALLNSRLLKRGSVIVWDEAGVGIPRRDWYDISNKLINYVLQTFRTRNIVVIFTTPALSYIDSNTCKLFQAYIEMQKIKRKEKLAVSKYFLIQYNSQLDKTYYKYPVVRVKGKRTTLKRISFPKPNVELWRKYTTKRRIFTNKLFKDAEVKLKRIEEKEKHAPTKTPEQITEAILNSPAQYLNTRGRVDREYLMARYNLGRSVAGKIKAMVDRQL